MPPREKIVELVRSRSAIARRIARALRQTRWRRQELRGGQMAQCRCRPAPHVVDPKNTPGVILGPMHVSRAYSAAEFWAVVRGFDDQVRESSAQRPSFAPSDWSGARTLGEWSFGAGNRALTHGVPDDGQPFINVVVSSCGGRETARELWANSSGPPTDAADRPLRLLEFEAQTSVQRAIAVDDAVLEFDVWEHESRWWAAVSRPGYGIALEARNIDPTELHLVSVDDIEPYIAGRNQRIKEQREES